MNAALAAGSRVITPARCDITENSWSGAGYLTVGPGLQFEMLISDGLAGGFGTMAQIAAQLTAQVGANQPQSSKLAAAAFTFNDPIDMVRGNFVYDHDDIDVGIGAFTADHLALIHALGLERVIIRVYDRDEEAGDAAAVKLAERLTEEGFGCYRLRFPHGLDANEYALKVTPAVKSLGGADPQRRMAGQWERAGAWRDSSGGEVRRAGRPDVTQ